MAEVSVKQLATDIDTPVDRLLQQFVDAGIVKSKADDMVSESEKQTLLAHLKKQHGGDEVTAPARMTLQRKTKSTISVQGTGGKNKEVQVEVRKSRTYVRRSALEDEQRQAEAEETARLEAEEKARREAEEKARLDAEEKARREAEQARREAEEKARIEAQQKARQAQQPAKAAVSTAQQEAEKMAKREAEELKRQQEQTALQKAEELAAKKAEEARIMAEQNAARWAEEEAARAKESSDYHLTTNKHAQAAEDELDRKEETSRRTAAAAKAPKKVGRREDDRNDRNSRDPRARKGKRGKMAMPNAMKHGFNKPAAVVNRDVVIGETITVAELANKMAVKGVEVIKVMMKMGAMATINQVIDQETAQLVAEEMGHKVVLRRENELEEAVLSDRDETSEAKPRAPVVTIMGHVDHGKTSLLDYIRRTKVATGEAGGITQHIGAYHVDTPKGVISFLDTPGHAAFTSMRARGAKLTDIVVLVVAADDGVMPQTKEAIQHARSAGVPLIVAINKIDKSDADPMRVKNELLSEQVVAEDFGGDTQMVEISAKTGLGIDDLLDAISIQAELLELKAVDEGRASGVVIESSLDKGRGPVATVLVQQGRLKKGDYLVCGIQYGRVRALFDETGKQPEFAGPSIPVQVLGLSGVPEAGDDFVVVEDERLAKDVAQQRETKRRESRLVATAGSRMEDIMATLGKGEGQQVLNLVIKADVQGSVQALSQALVALSNEDIRINVIHSGVGGITESDANSAAASKATVIGFNVRADASARRIIESNGVDLRYFSIIYDVIDQVKQVASGLLGVEIREEIIGIAEVRDVFRSSKLGAVAGSMVIEGVVRRNKPIRVLRDSVVIFEGELESLRRFKENVEEVRNGTECGIAVKAYNDVKPGDQIECFERIEVPRTL